MIAGKKMALGSGGFGNSTKRLRLTEFRSTFGQMLCAPTAWNKKIELSEDAWSLSTAQVPEHRYIDDRTHDDSTLNLWFNSSSLMHSICCTAMNFRHAVTSLSAIFFVK